MFYLYSCLLGRSSGEVEARPLKLHNCGAVDGVHRAT